MPSVYYMCQWLCVSIVLGWGRNPHITRSLPSVLWEEEERSGRGQEGERRKQRKHKEQRRKRG